MGPFLQEAQNGGELFGYNWTLKSQDREAMWKYRMVLAALLKENPTGVFKKTIMESGLKKWQECVDAGLSTNRTDTFMKDQSYNLTYMLQCVKDVKKFYQGHEIARLVARPGADVGGGLDRRFRRRHRF